MIAHIDKCIDKRGQVYLAGIFDNISIAMGCQTITEAIFKFRQMPREIDIQNPVSDNRKSDITLLSSSVNPIRLKNNPVALDEMAIKKIYERIIK